MGYIPPIGEGIAAFFFALRRLRGLAAPAAAFLAFGFRAAFFAAGLAAAFLRRAGFRAVFLAAAFLRVPAFFAVDLRAVFLRVVVFRFAVDFLAVVFFAAVRFFAAGLRAVFLAVDFRAPVFFAAAFGFAARRFVAFLTLTPPSLVFVLALDFFAVTALVFGFVSLEVFGFSAFAGSFCFFGTAAGWSVGCCFGGLYALPVAVTAAHIGPLLSFIIPFTRSTNSRHTCGSSLRYRTSKTTNWLPAATICVGPGEIVVKAPGVMQRQVIETISFGLTFALGPAVYRMLRFTPIVPPDGGVTMIGT